VSPPTAERYRAAANRFLQSAVVIDDRAALAPEDDEIVPAVIEDPRPRPTEVDKEEANAQAKLDAENEEKAVEQGETAENRLDARKLLDRFASFGMVCGVLRPGTDVEATETLALTAGARTDMVILDWHLDDSGTLALHLLDELSKPGSKRLRLVCIYTGDGGEQVTATIASLEGNEKCEEFIYQRGSTRMVVLYKAGAERTGAPPERVVNVSDLPGRLLAEFAALCAGLVSAAAMSALGAVREAMPEILGVLVPELDAAYVGQRLSQDRPDDAIDQLAELVVSEIQSVIEDDEPFASTAGEAAVESWLEDEEAASRLPVELAAVKEMNRLGGQKAVRAKIGESFQKFQEKTKRHPTELVVIDPAEAELADARLAQRMTTRHRYPNAKRGRLELGVVIESTTGTEWWLCVQPLCDSVRLTENTRMPFLPYHKVTEEPFDLVDVQPTEILRLRLSLEPSDVKHVTFAPDQVERSVLVTTDDGDPRFIDVDGASWKLVCRLKAAHAQRIAHSLGAKFSRVGLNESEWLRKKARQRD